MNINFPIFNGHLELKNCLKDAKIFKKMQKCFQKDAKAFASIFFEH